MCNLITTCTDGIKLWNDSKEMVHGSAYVWFSKELVYLGENANVWKNGDKGGKGYYFWGWGWDDFT
jgi:hypothetical protein